MAGSRGQAGVMPDVQIAARMRVRRHRSPAERKTPAAVRLRAQNRQHDDSEVFTLEMARSQVLLLYQLR